jgi:hypothetical protein
MAAILKKLGFTVTLKQNAKQQEMEEAIEAFGNSLKRGGVGLFYYAGHGVQVNGANYLLPIGARINKEADVKYQGVDANKILDEMATANNGLNIVMLDACRDNPYARNFRNATRGLAIVSSAPSGTFISYSTSPGNVARDGDGRNSPYTEALLENIAKPGLTINDIFINVRAKVKKETGQVPWELSSLEGQFYFMPQGSRQNNLSDASFYTKQSTPQLEFDERRLSSTQLAFERSGSWRWDWTSSNRNSVDFWVYDNSLATSPAFGPVTMVPSTTTLIGSASSAIRKDSILVAGKIKECANLIGPYRFHYIGEDVIEECIASDGTAVTKNKLTDFVLMSAPETFGDLPDELANYRLPLSDRYTQGIPTSAKFVAGAKYSKYKRQRVTDYFIVYDWDDNPSNGLTPVKEATTIEQALPYHSNTDNVTYHLGDGVISISAIAGARVWIAEKARPVTAIATESYRFLAEANGRVYTGCVQKSGTVVRYTLKAKNKTMQSEYSWRLNDEFKKSIANALRDN